MLGSERRGPWEEGTPENLGQLFSQASLSSPTFSSFLGLGKYRCFQHTFPMKGSEDPRENSRFSTHGAKMPLGLPADRTTAEGHSCSQAKAACSPSLLPVPGFIITIEPLNSSLRGWGAAGQTRASVRARWPSPSQTAVEPVLLNSLTFKQLHRR